MEVDKGFESWAIIELFGHNTIAGFVSEQEIGGSSFVRVDVPETKEQPKFTKFFGHGAIYAITPTTEDIAKIAAEKIIMRPVSYWIVPDPTRELPEPDEMEDEY